MTEDPNLHAFANNIRALRTREDLTQDAFGTRIGATGRTIVRWERGEVQPQASHLEALYDEFQVKPEDLFRPNGISDGKSISALAAAEATKRSQLERKVLKHEKTIFKLRKSIEDLTERLDSLEKRENPQP